MRKMGAEQRSAQITSHWYLRPVLLWVQRWRHHGGGVPVLARPRRIFTLNSHAIRGRTDFHRPIIGQQDRNWSGLRLIVLPMIIGPLQGLFDDWAGESFGWVDANEQRWYAAFGGPRVCLGWERVVDPGQGGGARRT
jgi:hypothetical protein